LDLDSPWSMRTLPENIHRAARMVAALWPLQLSLPATGMGVGTRIGQLGTIGSRCQRSKPITGPFHRGALVLAAGPLCDSSVKQAVARSGLEHIAFAHHPCLGLERDQPYSAGGGRQFVNRKALDELKQQIPLLDYLQAHDWQAARSIRGGRLMGLCPLHTDRKPSFLVDPGQNLFYCYGCARGGDVIRFAELYHQVKFTQAVTLLREWCGVTPLLEEVTNFYRMQLSRHREAVAYLEQRGLYAPGLIEHMRIGYAPGRCLRAWLNQLGYPFPVLRQAGLVDATGCDTYSHRIVFPLEGNLYGRSILDSVAPHRFLPAGKGGLYAWEQVRRSPEIILVEGLFDYAVLWQAGFHNVTCSLGNHLNARQFLQLCDASRTVYLAFDTDPNGSGQSAAQQISRRLWSQGVSARRVPLPEGQDPNSFFVRGGNAQQFQLLLEAALP
jgi:DNA primase